MSGYIVWNKIVFFNIVLKCISASNASEEICYLPIANSNFRRTLQTPVSNAFNDSTKVLTTLIQNGIFYVKGGIANIQYGICFTYITD